MEKTNTLPEKPDKGTLRPYQIDDLSSYISNDRHANLSDPSTGKTPSVCVFLQYLWEYEGCKTAWAMPKSLLGKNYDEVLRFTDFQPQDVVVVDGTPSARERQIATPTAKVLLMGFQRWSDDWERILQAHPDINALAVDEIHMGYKTIDSKRTKGMLRSLRKIRRFLPMTGTLIDGRLDSCYPTIHAIEPRYYYNHDAFMLQHGIFDFDGNLVGWQNHEKLGRIFVKHAIRRTIRDIYGPSDHVIVKRQVEMHTKQREAYKQLEELALLELEDDFIDASLPGVNAIRCRQVMAHPHTFGLMKPSERTGKEEQLLLDLTDHYNSGKPALVFAVLKPEQERALQIARSVGLRVELLNGDVTGARRSRIDQGFRSGEIDVLIASPLVASVGFNWGHVDHVMFLSLDYQDSSYKQAILRADRGERTTPLRVSIYEYKKSIDQRIFAIVDRKSRDANKVDASVDSLSISRIGTEERTMTLNDL